MCGIAGIFDCDHVTAVDIERAREMNEIQKLVIAGKDGKKTIKGL